MGDSGSHVLERKGKCSTFEKMTKKTPLSFYTFQLSLVKTNIYVAYICGGSKWIDIACNCCTYVIVFIN